MTNEIEHCTDVILKGGLILYPTDTIWGIGCDVSNNEAVSRIYTLKKRIESKSMICLISDLDMLKRYINAVPVKALEIIGQTSRPTTIVYDNPVGLASNLLAEDGSVGIRLVKDGFSHELIKKLNHPIVSTSANISGNPSPKAFKEIQKEILTGVDYVVNLPDNSKESLPSKVIKISGDGEIHVLRA